jgi:hypothetical protein
MQGIFIRVFYYMATQRDTCSYIAVKPSKMNGLTLPLNFDHLSRNAPVQARRLNGAAALTGLDHLLVIACPM